MYEVEIEDIPAVKVATLLHHGDYGDLPFDQLHNWGSRAGHLTPRTRWMALFYSHDKTQPDVDKVSKAGFTIEESVVPEGEIGVETIFGGRYAVLHHVGPYSEMHKAGRWFMDTWLPASNEALIGDLSYDEYLDAGSSVAPEHLRTKVYFPLASQTERWTRGSAIQGSAAQTGGRETMVNPIKREIGAVFLPVRDIEAARAWYCDLLGLEGLPDIEFGHICVIPMTDGSGFVLDSKGFVAQRSGTPAFHFNSDDLSSAFAYMRAKGVTMVGEITDGIFFNFQDPDGNLLMVADVPPAPKG